jgi:drug/metabolite transporter (DMT)-like permease
MPSAGSNSREETGVWSGRRYHSLIRVSDSIKLSPRVVFAFVCVYVFWGSTYLAIRFGVEVLSPFVLGSVRFLIAGPLMLGFCAARGMRIRPSRRDLVLMILIGVLILGVGNTGVMWSEKYLASGLAALLVAVIPMYVALVEVFLPGGEGLRAKGWVGIAIGFAGLVVLVSPGLHEGWHGHSGQLIASVVALASAFSWTCGSVLSRRAKLATSAFIAAGWQMLFAGVFNFGLVLAFEGTRGFIGARWSMQAFWSVVWLVTFGSLVGYSAYIYLLENVPVAKVSTYAYINPIIAVILGALFLQERMVPLEYLGMVAIVIAVYLVTSSKLQSGVSAGEAELGEVEPQA